MSMLAFSLMHADEKLWSLVACIGKLPDLQPAAYTAMVQPVRRRNTPLRNNQWEDTSTRAGAMSLVLVLVDETPPEIQRAKADV